MIEDTFREIGNGQNNYLSKDVIINFMKEAKDHSTPDKIIY